MRTVGCRNLEAHDPTANEAIPAWVLYPTEAPARVERFGPYELAVALNAPAEGRSLPLVVISHGNGGSPWSHRETAAHLARAGFAVALLEHPGNSRSDNRLAFTATNLANRPRHLNRVIEAVFRDPELADRLVPDALSIIGHSIGGYTALALAGGHPTSFPKEEPDGQARAIPVVADPRVRALVLLAPATPWFLQVGALRGVRVPILMRTGERDEYAHPLHAEIVLNGVPDVTRVEHQVVSNAGHFSFQSPFPAAMVRPDFPPSQDPPGFDRAAYHPILNAEIEAFLRNYS